MLRAALGYAAAGFPVFPLHGLKVGACTCGSATCGANAGKHPLTKHGLKDASRSADVIEGWWKRWPVANIGVRTGPESKAIVIDVDPRHGGTLETLTAICGALPATWVARTGSGGWHIWFAYPEFRLGNRAGVAPGIDVRGLGGYVVAPPSLHRSGDRYEWEIDPANALAQLPKALASILRPVERPVGDLKRVPLPAIESAVDGVLRILLGAREGERNNVLFWSACRFGEMVRAGRMSTATAQSLLWEGGRRVGLAGRELAATVDSGLAAGRGDRP